LFLFFICAFKEVIYLKQVVNKLNDESNDKIGDESTSSLDLDGGSIEVEPDLVEDNKE